MDQQEERSKYPRSYALDAIVLIESIRERLKNVFFSCKQESTKSKVASNYFLPSGIEELETVLSVCEELLDAYTYPCEILDIDEEKEAAASGCFKSCIDQPVLHAPWESPRKSLLSSGIRFQNKRYHRISFNEKSSPVLQIAGFPSSTAAAALPPHQSSLWVSTPHATSSSALVNQIQGDQQQTDTLLFHLVVALQLCQVRVEEACSIFVPSRQRLETVDSSNNNKRINKIRSLALGSLVFAGTICILEAKNGSNGNESSIQANKRLSIFQKNTASNDIGSDSIMKLFVTSGKAFCIAFSTYQVRRWWRSLCVNARIADSLETLNLWQQKWILCQCYSAAKRIESTKNDKREKGHQDRREESQRMAKTDYQIEAIQATTKKLLECISLQSPNKTFWHSQGGLRFLLLKRAMDLVYASVGTAIQVTEGNEKHEKTSSLLWMPVAAAAASYYVLTGADATSLKAQEALSSAVSSDIICRSWKLVGLPAIKRFSLEVSKLLKGAAIATSVTLAGVPCFVISSNPCAPLAAALKRSLRRQRSTLETIIEAGEDLEYGSDEEECNGIFPQKDQKENLQYPLKDVILHLTGGGFFSHTIASDLPFLIDWSSVTDAVVICPEYSLLPEHCFPIAINQIRDIYRMLVRGDASPLLGFRVRKVVITGESVGGNLGAALLVKLFLDAKGQTSAIRLPDAMMLCCPVLNLAKGFLQSRVISSKDDDPILPNCLISTISEAYLPTSLGLSKQDPVASPYYASDEILSCFPPNLIFASSTDPLLDDSVVFNTRLARLGVESDLRAAHNMPHAYWGLGTAGFPEAKQVQSECKLWLNNQLNRNA